MSFLHLKKILTVIAHIAPALHSPDNFYSHTFHIFLHWVSLCVTTSLQRTCFEFTESLIDVEFSHLAKISSQGHLLLAPLQEIHGTLVVQSTKTPSLPSQPALQDNSPFSRDFSNQVCKSEVLGFTS